MNSISRNHFFELLNNDKPDIIWDFDNMNEINYKIDLSGSCEKILNNKSLNKNILKEKMKNIIDNKEYKNLTSPFSKLKFISNNNFILISTHDISDNLKHANKYLDNVLRNMRWILFDKNYNPILYVQKPMKKKLYDLLKYKHLDFSNIKNFKIQLNHIGKYTTIFNHNNIWYFIYDDDVKPLTLKNHSILYELIEIDLHKLNPQYSYEFIMVDNRLNTLVKSPFQNHLILLNIKNNFESIPIQDEYSKIRISKDIHISSMDEFKFYLEEIDYNNATRLNFKGIIISYNNILISTNTKTYDYVLDMIPKSLTPDQTHFYLYQKDKLNQFISLVDDSQTDIVKRINISITTISHELLDIYHSTRNKQNSNLYSTLTKTYINIINKLHSIYKKMKKNINHKPKSTINNIMSNKISITIDHVYTLVKDLDINIIIELYRDREIIMNKLKNYKINSPFRNCSETLLEQRLLN